MSCITFLEGDSLIHKLDPRAKLIAAVAFSVLMAISRQIPVLCSGLLWGALLAAIARLPLKAVLKRVVALNMFCLVLMVLLLISQKGLLSAAIITLRGNAIVIVYTALLSTIEISRLGHALLHLRVPNKLAHLFLFTVRYINTLHHEYQRLATAAKARGFRMQMNMHAYRSIGYLVGMLLVRSIDRSQRVLAAMKCRGYNGKLYILNHFDFGKRDLIFSVLSLAAIVVLAWMELL